MSTWAQIMAGSRVTITVRFSICLSSLFIYSIWSDILVSLHPSPSEILRNYQIAKSPWGLKDAAQGKRHSPGLFAVSQTLWELPLISPCQLASLMKTQNKIKVILHCSLLRDKDWHSRGKKFLMIPSITNKNCYWLRIYLSSWKKRPMTQEDESVPG